MGEEEYQLPSHEEILYYEGKAENGKAIAKLAATDEFQLLLKIYAEAFALNALQNFNSLNDEGRKRFNEKLAGRSAFMNFIQDVIQEGKDAEENLALVRSIQEQEATQDDESGE